MDNPILFGRFLVREGKISEKELLEVSKIQTEINRSFAVVALEGGFIGPEDFKAAIAYQRQKGIRFRDALTELKIADDETVGKIDKAQKDNAVRLGELLVKRGAITEEGLGDALNDFKEKGTVGYGE
ncbi:MAG: hypothetical protein C4560_07785 [Nitrospiraceae bacterium]|nr:MAG: hypothetical protein C4560_07785 [Nitrospiraceae bacterium]